MYNGKKSTTSSSPPGKNIWQIETQRAEPTNPYEAPPRNLFRVPATLWLTIGWGEDPLQLKLAECLPGQVPLPLRRQVFQIGPEGRMQVDLAAPLVLGRHENQAVAHH